VIARWAAPAALAGLALGVLIGDASPNASPAPWLLVAGATAALAALASGGGARAGSICLAIALFAAGFGAWRGAAATLPRGPDSVADNVGQELTLVGSVIDEPRPRGDRQQLVIDNVAATGPEDPRRLKGRVLVWLPRGIAARAGDRISLMARLEEPRDFDGFAYRAYLARQGVGAIARAYAANVQAGAADPGAPLRAVRAWLLHGLNAIVPEPEAALGAGILLGVRSGISPEIEQAFATAGLTHVVAISGWNIAIVAALAAGALQPLRRRPGGLLAVPLIGVVVVGGYVLLTGASPSVMRAALMAGALLVARLGGSRSHAVSALVLAALVMLAAAPPVLWDVGFQLSLLATAGLIWFGPSIERRLQRLPAWIREPVALTLAAQLTTLPVILVNFERLSLVAPVANVVVVPLVPLAMFACAVAAPIGALGELVRLPLVTPAAEWFAGGAAWLALRTMSAAGAAAAAVPYAAIDVSVSAIVAAGWYPALGLVTWARSGRLPARPLAVQLAHTRPPHPSVAALARILAPLARPLPATSALVVLLAVITVATRPDGRLHLTVLDIGQGDAILIEAPSGATAVIDGGPDPELVLTRLGDQLPFAVREIDVLVLSHPHQDHVAGLVDILDRHRVLLVLHAGIGFDNPAYYRLLADAVRERGARLELARAGSVIRLDPLTTLEIIYPTADDAAAPLPEGDINNGSIVAVLRHGHFAALLTGDAEAPLERRLLDRGLIGPVDVLKIGHHGSNSSTTPELVAVARPRVAIISAGADNEYGHPAPETLATLAAAPDLVTYRTDVDGSVEVISDGIRFEVVASRSR
jgi:competence protein ComEC